MSEKNATRLAANYINEAKACAREAILETYPDANETAESTEGSYEYDAVIVEGEDCDVYEVGIMHDAEANTFALVEKSRAALELAEQAEHELAIADLMRAVEVKVMMLVCNCRTQDEVTAAWAAISASTSQTVRDRLRELGGDSDAAVRSVDRFLLTNPQ